MKELQEIDAAEAAAADVVPLDMMSGSPFVCIYERPYKRRRQGRSAETRARKLAEITVVFPTHPPLPSREYSRTCKNCGSVDQFAADHGCEVCIQCGGVVEDYTDDQQTVLTTPQCQRFHRGCGYKRDVHFMVRIRQLTSTDPVLHPVLLDVLYKMIYYATWLTLEERFGPKVVWGPKTFRAILKLPPVAKMLQTQVEWGGKRVSHHWIQLRERLGVEPYKVTLGQDAISMMRLRYQYVAKAFKAISGERRNIYTLNYIIAQLMFMEVPYEDWLENAKFLPQNESPRQPQQNNEYWWRTIQWCREHANFVVTPENCFHLEWPYHPITNEEIIGAFTYFR